ncbi:MAG TPA: MBL fold metallo-hydrolase [Saprospiraceae bacterium]|nr:MBL fold metallo-hydrolase [Saprospiraceae bacterium]
MNFYKIFGQTPSGKRSENVKLSPNYKNGAFQNLSHTPDLSEDATFVSVLYEFLFKSHKRAKPKSEVPSIKTDLLRLDTAVDVLIWFGHSSYFMQLEGKRILVDPVFAGYAAPFSFSNKSFDGTDVYSIEDLPYIDYLLISHDHYDHLDYETILKLESKVGKVICGLGTGQHFEYWGYDTDKIIEKDWHQEVVLDGGIKIYVQPSRHFSGRLFKRNQSLWVSFVLTTPKLNIYAGGDSGYDTHFAEIGNRFGPFDLAILDNGQYDKSWKYIHMFPEEVLKAAQELKAKRLMPVHSAKFVLANHAWDEPLERISTLNQGVRIPLVTPMIGEVVTLNDTTQAFQSWWRDSEQER